MRMPAALTLAMAAILALSACAQAPGARFTPGNAVIRVTFENMKMKVDAASAPAGKVTFLVTNLDTVEHEVVILKTDKAADKLALLSGQSKVDEGAAGENVGEVEVEAGTTAAGTFELAPAKYVLICNVLTHYAAGMFAPFGVTVVAGKPQEGTAAKPAATNKPITAPAVPGQKEITLIKTPRPYLVDLVAAATKGDFVAARKAIKAYNTTWNGIEVYVSYRYPDMYTEVEAVREAKATSLLDATPPNQAEVVKAAQAVLDEYDLIIAKITAGAPPISPLFDDIADLRILRTNTIRDAVPAIKAGDVATAKSLLGTFITKWADIEDLIHDRSSDAYAEIEAAMSKVNTAVQKSSTTASELGPLADTLSNRFNYGISLVNAAARGADISKKTFTTDDVQVAAGLVAINNALKTSLTAWQAGKYPDALASAQQASGPLFAKVAGALKAKNGADAAPLKALTAYADLAGKAGDATTVSGSQKAAVEAVLVAQQWIVGQFWTDPKLKDAITAALSGR